MAKMRTKGLLVLIAVAVTSIGVFVPANAFDQALKPIELSQDKLISEQSFIQMAGQDPVGQYGVEECRTTAAASCDTIPFILDVPKGFIHLTILTMSFDHGDPGDTGVGANDLDLFVYEWNGKTNTAGAPVYESVGSAASQSQPEVFKVADIPARSADNPYWLVVVNFTGSSAYTMKGELRPQSQDFSVPGSGSTPRPRQITTQPTKPAIPKAAESSLPQFSEAENEKLPAVKVPGADGELAELPLVAIRGQVQEQKASNRTPLVIGTVALLALAAATFAFFFIRSRRRSEEPAA